MCISVENLEIILCTDGLSNTGIGAIERSYKREDIRSFYLKEIGQREKSVHCSISTIAIEGGETGMDILGSLSEATNGSVNFVKAIELQRKMRSIVDNSAIAKNAKLTFVTEKGFTFHNSQHISKQIDNNKMKNKRVVEIGNVTPDTDVTIDFHCKKPENYNRVILFHSRPLSSMRFLLKQKTMRTVTYQVPITFDRDTSWQYSQISVLSVYTLHQVAKDLKERRFREGRTKLKTLEKLHGRIQDEASAIQQDEYTNFCSFTKDEELDKVLSNSQKYATSSDNLMHHY
jgi:hypothetical protein